METAFHDVAPAALSCGRADQSGLLRGIVAPTDRSAGLAGYKIACGRLCAVVRPAGAGQSRSAGDIGRISLAHRFDRDDHRSRLRVAGVSSVLSHLDDG